MESIKKSAQIDNSIRTAKKIFRSFDLYPIIPTGDLTVEFIEKVFVFQPLYVLDDLKREVNLAIADFKDDADYIFSLIQPAYDKYEKYHKKRILDILIENFRGSFSSLCFKHSSYMTLRPTETLIFYYAYSIFYIAREIKDVAGLRFSKVTLDTIKLLECEKRNDSYLFIESGGKMLCLPEFNRDKRVYEELKKMIDEEIMHFS